MKKYFLLFIFIAWQLEYITGDQSTDPRSNPRIDNALRESSHRHCDYKCRHNLDDCSNDAGGDFATCERLLYWVYLTNYEVCMTDCNKARCNESCRPYIDCEPACLRIATDKIRLSSKTPDELIHTYFANRQVGRKRYIGD